VPAGLFTTGSAGTFLESGSIAQIDLPSNRQIVSLKEKQCNARAQNGVRKNRRT
jgi:hypothetical protein